MGTVFQRSSLLLREVLVHQEKEKFQTIEIVLGLMGPDNAKSVSSTSPTYSHLVVHDVDESRSVCYDSTERL